MSKRFDRPKFLFLIKVGYEGCEKDGTYLLVEFIKHQEELDIS